MVTANPSYDEMKKVVTEQEKRPLVPNRWTENSVSGLSQDDKLCAFQISNYPKFTWMPSMPQKGFGAVSHPIILTILQFISYSSSDSDFM